MSALVLVAIAGLLLLLGGLQLLMSRRQRRRTGLPGGQVVYRDVEEQRGATLRARTLALRGRPDLLLRQGHILVPVEVKTGRTPAQPHASHIMQLLAYCLLVAETHGTRPPHGVLRYPQREL
jgi:CRISPR-associated exonuclease Cas4